MVEYGACLSYLTRVWVRDIFCGVKSAQTKIRTNIVVSHFRSHFMALYGKTVTVQWRFGNGPDMPATNFHLSSEGLIK